MSKAAKDVTSRVIFLLIGTVTTVHVVVVHCEGVQGLPDIEKKNY